jgi:tRNA-specific 2-thiouridylase
MVKSPGMKKQKRVFVGMSGGVDSSVAAYLLKKEGYDVTGVFIKVWQADFLPCTWREERRDAMRAAAHIGIPFLTLDLEKEYRSDVVDYMVREYSAGRVPNPDVMCNKHVKFGAFLNFAISHGATHIATGHYASVLAPKNVPLTGGKRHSNNTMFHLLKSADTEKDQTYFLWTLTQDQLSHSLFPVGGMKKSEVRKIAKKIKLPNAEKKDSQGLCFMGKVNMRDFLHHFLKLQPGDVINESGKVIGRHDGALLYTIGQRHGFSVSTAKTSHSPHYVVKKNLEDNTVVVSESPRNLEMPSHATSVLVAGVNDISAKLLSTKTLFARIRYRGELHRISSISKTDTGISVRFSIQIPDVNAGQSMVFYSGRECLGGGTIEA